MFAVSSNGCLESWPTYQLKQCVRLSGGRWWFQANTPPPCRDADVWFWRFFLLRLLFHVSLRAVNKPNSAQCWSVLLSARGPPPADTQLHHGNSKTQSRVAFQRWRRLGGDGERCNDLWQQQNCGGRVFRFSPECFTVWLVADRTDVTGGENHAKIRLQLLLLPLKGEKTSLCSVWADHQYSSLVNLLISFLIWQWIIENSKKNATISVQADVLFLY